MVNSYGNTNQRPSRSIKKTNEGQIKVQFTDEYTDKIEYEDKLPEGTTEEDIKEKYGKLVWCEFKDCFWNDTVKDLQKTWGTIQGNPNYQPIGTNAGEAVFHRICSRPTEIALRFRPIRGATGDKVMVPYCYTAAKNGKTGHIDFSKLIQGDGSPYGGNIDSQTVNSNDYSYGLPSQWGGGRERIVNYGGQGSKNNRSTDHTIGE